MSRATAPARLEAAARAWLGTPFVAGAAVRGAGCDCAGLLEALAREAGLPVPPRDGRDLATGLAEALHRRPPGQEPRPGDVVLLAREPGGPGEHAALVTGSGTLIHAHWSQGVVESTHGSWFRARTVGVFAWPARTRGPAQPET